MGYTVASIDSNRNFADQVREQELSRKARAYGATEVCVREDFYLRFATGV